MPWKRFVCLIILFGFLYIVYEQYQTRKDAPLARDSFEYISSANAHYLTPRELAKFKHKALNGDLEAAKEVWAFYEYWQQDEEMAQHWKTTVQNLQK